MNVYDPKNRVTSRCSSQHRDVPESYISNVATLGPNVTTLQRGLLFDVTTQ